MDKSVKDIYVDEEVSSKVLSIINEAQKYVVIVSPWIKLWGHAENAFKIALKKGVKVTAIVRSDNDLLKNESLLWLVNSGVRVLSAENLHAKIYFNERDVVVSSMNLLESSAKNSLEIAWFVRDSEAGKQVRAYVTNTLSHLAKQINEPNYGNVHQPLSQSVKTVSAQAPGRCIRCGQRIPLNIDKPLCKDCYEVWAQWGDPFYPEDLCHSCGRPSYVTYAKPFCQECYRRFFG